MSYYCSSLIGKRDSNEDKHVVFENENKKYLNKNNINYYAVYDGHGGKEISSFLERELHQYFLMPNIDYNNLINLKKYIKYVFNHIQKKLDINYRNKAL
jgi:Serine/threonine protein phosphatase